jgi:hypothetical protein
LEQAVRDAGEDPTLGGLEYTADIVAAMDLGRMVTADASLGAFVQNLRRWFQERAWRARHASRRTFATWARRRTCAEDNAFVNLPLEARYRFRGARSRLNLARPPVVTHRRTCLPVSSHA